VRIAVFSEGEADEAALRILIPAAVPEAVPIAYDYSRGRGWPSVLQTLPAVIRARHYRQEADVLVVLVDADDSPIHVPDHAATPNPRCRGCRLTAEAEKVRGTLSSPASGGVLEVVVAVAAPCVEAWYLSGTGPQASEAAWLQNPPGGGSAPREKLKRQVYGTARPGREFAVRRAEEEALRLAANIAALEEDHPNGFGSLARRLRELAGGKA
jgi:hypothetical protein